jgi:RES domain-containing protein
MSEKFETAVAEYEQDLGIRPGTLCAYDIDIDFVADLTLVGVRAAIGISEEVLHCPWKEMLLVERLDPPTWNVAKQLIAEGYAGVRVPSTRGAGANVVLWRWNDQPSRRVKALDPLNDLPRDASSWRPA